MKKIVSLIIFCQFLLSLPVYAEETSSSIQNLGEESPAIAAPSEKAPWYSGKFREFGQKTLALLEDRVAIGFRCEYFKLKEDNDHYIGSVDHLESKQNYDPRPFLNINLARYFDIDWGMEFSWSRVAMDTITSQTDQNDGTLKLSGPTFMVNGSYANNSRFTPYAGLGTVYFKNTEVSEGWWHHGFQGENGDWRNAEAQYQEWRRNGSPAWPNRGYTRTFELDKTWGYALNIGCSARIYKALEADLCIRYTDAAVDNTYTLAYYGRTYNTRFSEFDISNYTYALGLKYQF